MKNDELEQIHCDFCSFGIIWSLHCPVSTLLSNGLPPSSHWWMRLLVPLDQSVRLNVGSMTSTHILPLSMSIHSFSANNAFQVLMFLPGFDCPLRRPAYVVELIASETFSRVISSGGRQGQAAQLGQLATKRGKRIDTEQGEQLRGEWWGKCRLSSSSNSSSHPQEHPPASVRPPY